jgi:hypothetical protein
LQRAPDSVVVPFDFHGTGIMSPEFIAALDKMMRADLDAWSSLWFWILVGSTIAVAIGIIGEAPEIWKEVGLGQKTTARIRKFWYIRVRRTDLNGWEALCPELISKNEFRPRWVVKLAFIGWLLVAAGVAGEGFAEYFVNDSETGIRAFDEARVTEATKEAGNAAQSARIAHDEADAVKGIADEARTDARDALIKSQAAQHELTSAEADAAKAQTASSDALDRANKADSLASDAQVELKRVTSPRRLSQSSCLLAALKPFSGTEYVFDGVAADGEAIQFLGDIDDLLKAAGWKRAKSLQIALGIPTIKPRTDEPDLTVPASLVIGVQITVESTSTQQFFRSTPSATWPGYLQAAVTLYNLIFSGTFPSPRVSDPHPFVLNKGGSTVVAINVGRKP